MRNNVKTNETCVFNLAINEFKTSVYVLSEGATRDVI